MEKDNILTIPSWVVPFTTIAIFVLFFVLPLIASSVFIVGAGEEGVVFNSITGVDQKPYGEGLHILIPIINQGIKYDVKIQREDETASAASKDLQVVTAQVAINFQPKEGFIYKLHQEIGSDYHTRVIEPAIQESIKASTAKFTAEELITKREEVKQIILQEIVDRLKDRYIIVKDVQIMDLDFSPDFNAAIEAKVTAQQVALKSEMDLQRIEIEAKQRVTQATAEAEATRLDAQAKADAVRMTGEAEANAIELKNKALQDSPKLVEYTLAQRWDGKVPVITGGTTNYLNVKDMLPAVSDND
jgi:regulator of protease activity HflC (stomatin/prohibitin superfamily)